MLDDDTQNRVSALERDFINIDYFVRAAATEVNVQLNKLIDGQKEMKDTMQKVMNTVSMMDQDVESLKKEVEGLKHREPVQAGPSWADYNLIKDKAMESSEVLKAWQAKETLEVARLSGLVQRLTSAAEAAVAAPKSSPSGAKKAKAKASS